MLDPKPKLRERRSHAIFKRPSGKWPLYFLYLAAAGLLVAGGVTAIRHARPSKDSLRLTMIQAGQAMVRANLDEDLKASFGGESETVVEELPGRKFLISGWVHLITSQGQIDRRSYSVVVYKSEADNWVGERVSVIPL